MNGFLFTILILIIHIDQYTCDAIDKKNPTRNCFIKSNTCTDFTKCCEGKCTNGAIVNCQSDFIDRLKRSNGGFMAGAAKEEVTESPDATQPSDVGPSDPHCMCNQKSPPVLPMTDACLHNLNETDQCPLFGSCCMEICSKNTGYAYACGQETDSSATPETECLCLNKLADTDQQHKGALEKSPPMEADYEDHTSDCVQKSTCQDFEACCVDTCKNVDKNTEQSPKQMCIQGKNLAPMKSSHTYCNCPMPQSDAGLTKWAGGEDRKADIAQIFKGGTVEIDYAYYYDSGVGRLGLSVIWCITIVCGNILNFLIMLDLV